jgi:signal transduction histidine kinase
MTEKISRIEIYLNRVAIGTALVVTLLPPAGYFLLATRHLEASLEVEARAIASIVNNYIARNPGSWRYQNERLAEVIRSTILPHTDTQLFDGNGVALAQISPSSPGFKLSRSALVFDFGVECGHVEVAGKLDEIIERTLIATCLSGLLGLLFFFPLRNLPLQALRRSNQELETELQRRVEAESQLRGAQERLAETDRLESVGRLAAGVAHEVKNPLTIIRFGIDYLSRQMKQDENQSEVLDDIRDAVWRADRIVKGLLDFASNKSIARVSIDLNEVVENAFHLTRHDLELHQIEVVRELQDSLPRLSGDPDRLVQVFVNLITNAAQAIGHDGRITVVSRAISLGASDLVRDATGNFRIGDSVIVVEIRDNGPGLSEAVKNKLFDPFFTTKPVGEGTGLGLSVARNIMLIHDGTLVLRNNPEGGTAAILTFKQNLE